LSTFIISCAHQQSSHLNNDKVKIPQKVMGKSSFEDEEQMLEDIVKTALQKDSNYQRFIADDLYLKASTALMVEDYKSAELIFSYLSPLVPKDTYVHTK